MRINKTRGQVSLEIGFALFCILLILYGTWNVFLWVNRRIIVRQARYDLSRTSAGKITSAEVQVSVADLPRLDIFAKP